jgi:uncharacterized membrane protein
MSIYRGIALRLFLLCGLAMGSFYLAQPTQAEASTCTANCDAVFRTCFRFHGLTCNDDYTACIAACNGL